MTLNDIKARCDEVGECWIWNGAHVQGGRYPRIWAPDYTKGGKKTSQHGRRAVWHVKTGQPIPEGWRVFNTCDCLGCLNPDHMKAGPVTSWGEHMAKSGRLKDSIPRRAAARKNGQKRSVFTQETLQAVLTSDLSGTDLSREMGVSRQAISKARNGKMTCFVPIGSPFAGLGAR